MQLRDLAASKRDMLMIDPRIIQVEAGYNIRDLSTDDAQAKLRDLAKSIASIGVQQPLTVRLKGEEVFVVAGHRRLAATHLAIEGGAEIKSVPCVAEPKGTSDADRCADLIVSNSGEPLTPLEKAAAVKRLVGFGWGNAEIAARCGWTSEQTVENYLTLLTAPEAVQEMVRTGELSATTAAATTRKHGAEAGEVIASAKHHANSDGKTRVTRAHVNAATGEFQATSGNVKVLIAALEKIAADGDEDAADIASSALETVGILKKAAA